jgi:hypothetical protein
MNHREFTQLPATDAAGAWALDRLTVVADAECRPVPIATFSHHG